jgi:hypothetical protein
MRNKLEIKLKVRLLEIKIVTLKKWTDDWINYQILGKCDNLTKTKLIKLAPYIFIRHVYTNILALIGMHRKLLNLINIR